jgi:hypothetical protein
MQNYPLLERLDLLPMAVLLTLRAELLTETSKPAHSWPNLPVGGHDD